MVHGVINDEIPKFQYKPTREPYFAQPHKKLSSRITEFASLYKGKLEHVFSGAYGSGYVAKNDKYGTFVLKLIDISKKKHIFETMDEIDKQARVRLCKNVPTIYGFFFEGAFTLEQALLTNEDVKGVFGIYMQFAGLQPDMIKSAYGREAYNEQRKDMCTLAGQKGLINGMKCLSKFMLAQTDNNIYNVLWMPSEKRFYLIDFGMAKVTKSVDEAKLINTSTLVYWVRDLANVGYRSDISWSCESLLPLFQYILDTLADLSYMALDNNMGKPYKMTLTLFHETFLKIGKTKAKKLTSDVYMQDVADFIYSLLKKTMQKTSSRVSSSSKVMKRGVSSSSTRVPKRRVPRSPTLPKRSMRRPARIRKKKTPVPMSLVRPGAMSTGD